jgi:hypothetical protein
MKYDSIFIIVNRLMKIAYFILYKEVSDAKELVYVFIRFISVNHRLLEDIILNKGLIFMSKFWKALTARLGINHKASTVYYP